MIHMTDILHDSPTIKQYKDTMKQCIKIYYPNLPVSEIDKILDYSIQKSFKNHDVHIDNSYTKKTTNINLLALSDYIASKEPIVTAFGTMFRKKGTVPNPMFDVIQSFLDLRGIHKNMMFEYPKGSEEFEKYNLLQSLDKIDANGTYGTLGMYSSLLYNVNVATSVTSQGRAFVSTMTLFFESFLANNVKFGSLDQVIEFINHICNDAPKRRFSDRQILDKNITEEQCFAKLVLSCGYLWVPDNDEMEVIWRTVCNLSQEDRNRVYYKNNLYDFVSNKKVMDLVRDMLHKLKRPLLTSSKIPKEIQIHIDTFTDLLTEYVFYNYMYIDRIDRCNNMIKSVTMVSDTDSTIVSVDAWYRFIAEQISGEEFDICIYRPHPILLDDEDIKEPYPEDDKFHFIQHPISFEEKKYDYNFQTDEVIEMERILHPLEICPSDNVRYSIINILAYVLDRCVNIYMEKSCNNIHSTPSQPRDYSHIDFTRREEAIYGNQDYESPKKVKSPCKIYAKNEFTFSRLMMALVKKNYASLIAVQEGHIVPEEEQLDVKGIEILHKSTKPKKTRDSLKKILAEDILRAKNIDQLKFIKDIIIFEKNLINSVRSGSREFFKPVTIKSINTYKDPMRIQGIKAAVAWNAIKSSNLPGINLEERNAVDIVKVSITTKSVEQIKDTHPEIYQNILNALEMDEFEGEIDAIAIPIDVLLPDWLELFINYDSILQDNIAGFPFESIGIQKMNHNITYTNILQL